MLAPPMPFYSSTHPQRIPPSLRCRNRYQPTSFATKKVRKELRFRQRGCGSVVNIQSLCPMKRVHFSCCNWRFLSTGGAYFEAPTIFLRTWRTWSSVTLTFCVALCKATKLFGAPGSRSIAFGLGRVDWTAVCRSKCMYGNRKIRF